MIQRTLLGVVVTALVIAPAACDHGDLTFVPEVEGEFDFEQGLDGWLGRGTDLGDPPVAWSIDRSAEQANEGSFAMRFELDNANDAGKIWIERTFEVEPNQAYKAEVTYSLGSSDFGDLNHWTLITGVHSASPQESADLTFQGSTANGATSDSGMEWVEHTFEFDVPGEVDGSLHVAVGIWGTWETKRIYYVDDLTVAFTRK